MNDFGEPINHGWQQPGQGQPNPGQPNPGQQGFGQPNPGQQGFGQPGAGQWGGQPVGPGPYGGSGLGPPGTRRASFGQRLVGQLVDGLVMSLISAVLAVPLILILVAAWNTEVRPCSDFDSGRVGLCEGPTDGTIGLLFLMLGFFFLLQLAAAFFMLIRPVYKSGQTVGRRVAGIKVVDVNDGSLLSAGRALGRHLMTPFSSFLFIGYLLMLWDANQQTLHDKVTNATVIEA